MSRRGMSWMMHTVAACLLALTVAPVALADATLSIGSKAPAIDIEHWVQDRGGAFKPIKEFAKGKVYVVEFWATWCGPCVMSMPHLASVQDEYADKGVTVISISDEGLDTIEGFLDRKVEEDGDKTYRDLTKAYCLTTDPDRSVNKDYMEAAGESGIPTAFIVGKTGEIEWIGHPMEMDDPLEKIVGDQWDRATFAREKQAMDALLERFGAVSQLLENGKAAEAVALIDTLLAEAPNEKAKAWLQGVRPRAAIRAGGPVALDAFNEMVKAADGSINELHMTAWRVVDIAYSDSDSDPDAALVAAAVAVAQKAVELDATRGDVLSTLARLQEIQGDLDKAIATQRKAVEHPDPAEKEGLKAYLKELEKKAAARQ
jgi:thiol-disulfide isomerase/thioredoxin